VKLRAKLTLVLVVAAFFNAAQAQQLNPEQLLNRAMAAQQRGEYAAAIRDYKRVLALRPHMVEAKVNLGAALAHEGQYDAAIQMYKSALPQLAQKNPVMMNIALAYYKKGDFNAAREQLQTLHDAQPEDVRTAILLGDTDIKSGKAEEAVSLLAHFEATNAQNLDFEFVYGSALVNGGKRRDGVAWLEKAAAAGNMADAYMLAGATLLKLNEYEQARRDLENALRLNPRLPGLYTLVGTARDKTFAVAEAEAAFREAIKSNPNDFDANLYLGAILCKRRELDEAKIYLDHALQLNPASSMARYEDAMLKSTSGEYATAAQELEKLVKDDPAWLEPHVELATLYYKLHRDEDGANERKIVEKLTAEQQKQGPQ
jgi:tetratricopeptide (TPR) repeat protein